jgi:LysR family nitrogen assimilation transcriptional regulator
MDVLLAEAPVLEVLDVALILAYIDRGSVAVSPDVIREVLCRLVRDRRGRRAAAAHVTLSELWQQPQGDVCYRPKELYIPMNLRRLSYFLRIASEGSLSRAARHFGIAQPALSRQIQLLESELGARLFDRLPRGLRLTQEGEYFRDALEQPVSEIEIAIKNVSSFPAHMKASLTIGLPPLVSNLIGARLVARIRNDLPNIALRVVEADSNKLAADLARRVVDVAILVSSIPEPRVNHAVVLSEPLSLVGSPDSPFLQRPSIRFRELQEVPLVLPPPHSGLRIILSRRAADAGIKLNAFIENDSLFVAKQLVKTNNVYALMPKWGFREEARRNELLGVPIVEPALAMPVMWAVKPDWRLPRAVYNELERAVFEEWYDAVVGGEWPADWVFDSSKLSLPCRPKQVAQQAQGLQHP